MTKKLLLLTAFVVLTTLPARSAAVTLAQSEPVKKQLNAELAAAKTPADSVKILYHLFDLSNRKERPVVGQQLFATAGRAGNVSAQLDILRNLAVYYSSSDSMLTKFHEYASALPASDDRAETLTFINIYLDNNRARITDEKTRNAELERVIQCYNASDDTTLYSRIESLFSLCNHMSQVTEGQLLVDYYERLRGYIDRLPQGSNALRNMYYTMAAIAYSNNGDHDHAVEADRKLLKITDELEKKYAAAGRKYRNYYTTRYVVYRRMLSNATALTPSELETAWLRINEIAAADPDIARDMESNHRAEIYYLMARKDYTAALPLLKEALPKADKLPLRMFMLKSIITAAEATGDRETLTWSAKAYSKALEEFIDSKSAERYRELQIIYEVNDLRQRNSDLVSESERELIRHHRIMLVVSGILIVALAALAVVLMRSRRRAVRMATRLMLTNRSLTEERDNLKRTRSDLLAARDAACDAERERNDFIHNISHEVTAPLNTIVEYTSMLADCVDDSQREYVNRFAGTITHNAEAVQDIMNEVLDIAAIDNDRIATHTGPVSLDTVCTQVCESTAPRVPKNVRLIFEPKGKGGDVRINSDRKRIEQVLCNLINNACKFTESGTITVDYGLNADGSEAVITVTDTGCGIPEGKEDDVFNRFEKINPLTPGLGLGLSISRHFAEMLGGSLRVDTSWPQPGTRMVFTIPVRK